MRSRRRTGYAVLAATAVLSVGALGQTSLAQSDAPPVTISWWGIPQGIVNVPGLEAETANPGDWERLMASRFSELHPNVTVDYQLIAAEDITAKMAAAVLAGQPPDVYFDAQIRQSPFALEEGVVEDISALVGPETMATVNQDLIPLVTLGGRVYTLPTHVIPSGWLLYNKASWRTRRPRATDGAWSYTDFDAALAATAIPEPAWRSPSASRTSRPIPRGSAICSAGAAARSPRI